jgi:hypothetical protein
MAFFWAHCTGVAQSTMMRANPIINGSCKRSTNVASNRVILRL